MKLLICIFAGYVSVVCGGVLLAENGPPDLGSYGVWVDPTLRVNYASKPSWATCEEDCEKQADCFLWVQNPSETSCVIIPLADVPALASGPILPNNDYQSDQGVLLKSIDYNTNWALTWTSGDFAGSTARANSDNRLATLRDNDLTTCLETGKGVKFWLDHEIDSGRVTYSFYGTVKFTVTFKKEAGYKITNFNKFAKFYLSHSAWVDTCTELAHTACVVSSTSISESDTRVTAQYDCDCATSDCKYFRGVALASNPDQDPITLCEISLS